MYTTVSAYWKWHDCVSLFIFTTPLRGTINFAEVWKSRNLCTLGGFTSHHSFSKWPPLAILWYLQDMFTSSVKAQVPGPSMATVILGTFPIQKGGSCSGERRGQLCIIGKQATESPRSPDTTYWPDFPVVVVVGTIYSHQDQGQQQSWELLWELAFSCSGAGRELWNQQTNHSVWLFYLWE